MKISRATSGAHVHLGQLIGGETFRTNRQLYILTPGNSGRATNLRTGKIDEFLLDREVTAVRAKVVLL